MTTPTIIGLASDHAGLELKEKLKTFLAQRGLTFHDYGTHTSDSCDYPDFAHALAKGIETGEVTIGMAVCGTGQGMAMTLNKHHNIRAALCWSPEIAQMTRRHNDANVLVLAGRYTDEETAHQMVDTFLDTDFEGGRHVRRIEKMKENQD